jgi:hypothetical protein
MADIYLRSSQDRGSDGADLYLVSESERVPTGEILNIGDYSLSKTIVLGAYNISVAQPLGIYN